MPDAFHKVGYECPERLRPHLLKRNLAALYSRKPPLLEPMEKAEPSLFRIDERTTRAEQIAEVRRFVQDRPHGCHSLLLASRTQKEDRRADDRIRIERRRSDRRGSWHFPRNRQKIDRFPGLVMIEEEVRATHRPVDPDHRPRKVPHVGTRNDEGDIVDLYRLSGWRHGGN